MVTIEEKIRMSEKNIRQMLVDYGKHTWDNEVLRDVSDEFICNLAEDNARAKDELRQLFRKSPAWDEELDAIVINGSRTHNPDPRLIRQLGERILNDPMYYEDKYIDCSRAIDFFEIPNLDEQMLEASIESMERLAPGAYVPGKKKSRIFRDICVALGVADNTAGSDFQRLYAQFADELTTRQISFKLIMSLNPAHFLSMSNPKRDNRGATLTSCHSFNSTEYSYNNGCSGYARDSVTFIVFTVKDFNDKESLNNRKTTRQIFCYKPGNGLLLQSRLYNTSGGTRGAQEESTIYRDLIQREISDLEDQPNLWNTFKYCGNSHGVCLEAEREFGGYVDWEFSDFVPMVSIRHDRAEDFENFKIGAAGLCIQCGEETSNGVYCSDCWDENHVECACCGEYFEECDLYEAHNCNGDTIWVCESCLENYYRRCDICGEYYDVDAMTRLADGDWVCRECRDDECCRCDNCGEWVRDSEITEVYNEEGDTLYICEDCEDVYSTCNCCGNYFMNDALFMGVCPDCQKDEETA